MFARIFSSAFLILVAIVSSILLLILLIIAAGSLTVAQTQPADILPADKTIALFSNVSEETLRKFETFFPKVAELRTVSGTTTLAVLRYENEYSLVQLHDDSAPRTGRTVVAGFGVEASNPKTLALLATQAPALSALPAFRALAEKRGKDDPWVFLDMSAMPPPTTLLQKLSIGLMPQDGTHIAFSETPDRLSIGFFGEKTGTAHGLSSVIRRSFRGVFATIRLKNPAAQWQKMNENLDAEAESFVRGTADKLTEDSFGKNTSFTYDIVPMLTELTGIRIGNTASGTPLWALEGMMPDTATLQSALLELHEGFRASIPTVRIVKRNLEDRFVSEDVRTDNRAFEEETQIVNNWNVQQTTHRDGHGFFSARKGRTFILANDEHILAELLQENADIRPPASPSLVSSVRLADGHIDADALKNLTQSSFPFLKEQAPFPLPFELTGRFLWTLEQQGPLKILTIQRENP